MAAARKARMFALGIGVGLVLDAAILAIVDLGKHAPYVNLKPKTKVGTPRPTSRRARPHSDPSSPGVAPRWLAAC